MSEAEGINQRWIILILVVVGIIALLTTAFADNFSFTFSLKEKAFAFDTVLQNLGPAIIASLFIERAVEVVVQTWRKFGKQNIENVLTKEEVKLKNEEDPSVIKALAESIEKTSAELTKYRQTTMEMAAGFSLFFGFLVALIGVRLLTPFFDIDAELLSCIMGLEVDPEECASGVESAREHYKWLVRYDVFITTFVIAGGSAGLHSIVSAITTFADNSKNNKPTQP